MKEKQCKFCGTKNNLRTNKNGVVYNCCINCYKKIVLPAQIAKANQVIKQKYGVNNLGELASKKAQQKSMKNEEVEKVCKYCQSPNVVCKKTEKRTIQYPVCEKHWELYQNEKHEKRKTTNKQKFGEEHPMYVKELNKKQRDTINNKTKKEKEDILQKRKETNIKKFGTEHPISLELYKKKRDANFKKKYGVLNPMQVPLFKGKMVKKQRENYWSLFIKQLELKKIEPCFSKDFYINITKGEILKYKCLRCNKIFESCGTEPQGIWCGCNQKRSAYEDELINWLKSVGVQNIESNKKFYEKERVGVKFEIDIFLKDYNIGIDFHGLYWHSELICGKYYHKNKYLYFKDKQIQLLQIFENEWLTKEIIVKSIIKNKLNMNNKIFARKCDIKEIAPRESKEFLELNHIQGAAPAQVYVGLFYEKNLVCVALFGKNRFKQDDSIELIRFCNKLNTSVTGGFQKIIKYFEQTYNPNSLVSFVDVRYFNGSGYIKSGFQACDLTHPNYFYFKENKYNNLYNRFSFQKHKLKNKLENFDPLLSEAENMYNNKYLRIFDAGNIKLQKTYS